MSDDSNSSVTMGITMTVAEWMDTADILDEHDGGQRMAGMIREKLIELLSGPGVQ